MTVKQERSCMCVRRRSARRTGNSPTTRSRRKREQRRKLALAVRVQKELLFVHFTGGSAADFSGIGAIWPSGDLAWFLHAALRRQAPTAIPGALTGTGKGREHPE